MNLLKEAEVDASKLVSEARSYRVDKIKLAKSNAESSITAYGSELEAAHSNNVAKQSNTAEFAELSGTADKEIAKLGQDFAANKDKVEKLLVDLVCST